MKKKTLVSWSSGKDSAWMLHTLRGQDDIEVAGLFSTVNDTFHRVAMHAVREDLLRQQADCLGLPLHVIPIPHTCDNATYEQIMGRFVESARQQHVGCMAFGDLYLEDIRQYRERALAPTGIKPVFPLWKIPTGRLAQQIVDSGTRAKITCIDPKSLAPDFAGREYDLSFLKDIPDSVDPCGENGEFHSFVYDGPMFNIPVSIEMGEVVHRDGFVFEDVLLAGDSC